jgi:hypothetical protein
LFRQYATFFSHADQRAPGKKQLKKRVAEAVVEKSHESDVDEDESAGWTEKVQGEK